LRSLLRTRSLSSLSSLKWPPRSNLCSLSLFSKERSLHKALYNLEALARFTSQCELNSKAQRSQTHSIMLLNTSADLQVNRRMVIATHTTQIKHLYLSSCSSLYDLYLSSWILYQLVGVVFIGSQSSYSHFKSTTKDVRLSNIFYLKRLNFKI
jgi:hypothetical protein